MSLPGDVIEFGIVRKGFKEYSHPGLLDFNRAKLGRIKGSNQQDTEGQPTAQVVSAIPSRLKGPPEQNLSGLEFSKRNMNL